MKRCSKSCLSSAVLVLAAAMLLAGCGGGSAGTEVAHYRDKVLTAEQLAHFVPEGSADSARAAQLYIENWKLDQALAQAALSEVPDAEALIAPRMDDYRLKLLRTALAEHLVTQKLDTLVTDEEMVTYYKEHADQYLADQNYYRYYFVATRNDDTPRFRETLMQDDAATRKIVLEWSEKNADFYKLDDKWEPEAEMQQVMAMMDAPRLLEFNKPGSTVAVKGIRRANGEVLYFFRMKGQISKGDYMPLASVRSTVKRAILHLRAEKLVADFEQNVISEANANGYFN